MKNHPIHFIVFLLILFCYDSATSLRAQNIYKRISAEKCDSLIQANADNPDFVILDVRTPAYWSNDHLEGSINRNYNDGDFEQQLDLLPKHKIFLLHCQSGGRSAGAFTKMQNHNFAEVYEMIGGINAWKSKGFSTTSEIKPKLMLVSFNDTLSNYQNIDSIQITITNRANGDLTFTSVDITDLHSTTSNFNLEKHLVGSEDYTFTLYHPPGFEMNDSTKIRIESNGGSIEINIVLKNGMLQSIHQEMQEEFILYPVPVQNVIYFKGSPVSIFEKVTVYDLNGTVILQNTNFSVFSGLDVSRLKQNLYLIRMETKQHNFVRKFTKQ